MPRDCGSRRYRIPVSTADAILRVFRPMPWSLPHRRGDGGGHVQSQHIVKNRILGQLSATNSRACSRGSRCRSFDQMSCSTSGETQSSASIFR